ncbi:MAG: L-ribulose-5-phosphate 4-epimerase AraD [bacterium]
MLQELKSSVFQANLELHKQGLIVLTFGNVSGIDRDKGIFVIKPSGVPYSSLKPADMVAVDLDGKVIDKRLTPSSDMPTHLELYRSFNKIGGVAHTHSTYATAFAQAHKSIPCFGTTHADLFHGPIPLTRMMSTAEIRNSYEINTGKVITRRFSNLDPLEFPGVLVASHGPFTWGRSAAEAVTNSVALEHTARIALMTRLLNPEASPIPKVLLDKHFFRKHGSGAYYGQKG